MPVFFADLLKSATEVVDDDYLSKYAIKAKVAPKACPVSFTIEDEISKESVAGTITLKYFEPTTGITFDKIKLVGSKYSVEASKSMNCIKLKTKLDPKNLSGASVTAELKDKVFAVSATADKKAVTASATTSAILDATLGGSAAFSLKDSAVTYSLGASYLFKGLFSSVMYSSTKKLFEFGFMFSPTSKFQLAMKFCNHKLAPTIGFKYGAAPGVTLGAKTCKNTVALVCINKIGKDATVIIGAESNYATINATPKFGASITIG